MMAWQGKNLAAFIAVLISAALILPAFAEPPPWAPAWGWRAKHHQHERDEDEDEGRQVYVVPRQPVYVSPYGASQGTCYREALGALIGAGTGAYVGSNVGKGGGRTAAIVGGGIIGAIVGGIIGRSMDQVDQHCVGQVLEYAETGHPVEWRNPDNGASYTVSPVKTYQESSGRYCREYTATARVAGRPQQTYGTACRQPDGSWQLAN